MQYSFKEDLIIHGIQAKDRYSIIKEILELFNDQDHRS